jgi:hypothetical protein
VVRINEARDLGDWDRFQLYERMKAFTAAPPDILRVNQKYTPECYIPNCCGVLVTTNHKSDGIYVPAEDRRHYFAWSECQQDDPRFTGRYWDRIWSWLDAGGRDAVAAWLMSRDLSRFNPKAPPEKTDAFWAAADAYRSPEAAEVADLIDALGQPGALTIAQLIGAATDDDLKAWLKERKNRKTIPHRLENCGYRAVRNPDAKDGLWRVRTHRQAIYARSDLPASDRFAAAVVLSRQ